MNINKNSHVKLDRLASSISRSWEEVKQMEAGVIESKSAMSFVDEL